MPLPNPDLALVGALDALLAVPQGRGTPLPRLLLGFERARQAGFLVMGIALVATGQFGAALLYGGLAASLTITAPEEAARLGADARDWSPRRASLYRCLALRTIEAGLAGRMLALTAWAASAALLVGELRGGATEAIVVVSALTLLCAAQAAHAYASCALPRDPDAPAPRAAMSGC